MLSGLQVELRWNAEIHHRLLLLLFLPRLCPLSSQTSDRRDEEKAEFDMPNFPNQGLKALIEIWRQLVALLQEVIQLYVTAGKRLTFLSILCCFIAKCVSNVFVHSETRSAELVYFVDWFEMEDPDSVWPPAGAKVRPPRRGKTPVFLFFLSHIPRCSHTLRSPAYDRQQSRGNYPSTPPPLNSPLHLLV